VFSAPKSFSLLYAISEDERLLDVFRGAVNATMEEIEADMKTRVRSRGRDEDRATGNAVWGEFVHFTSRPVDGEPDPHLHAHCFVHNLTWDGEEQRWKAGQFGDIKADAPYYEGRFKARLGHELLELGVQLEPTTDGWEVASLSRETLENFSRRTIQIEEAAVKKGITDPTQKAGLGAVTREKKAKNLTLDELRTAWKGRLSVSELNSLMKVKDKIGKGRIREDREAVAGAIDQAADHVFERSSTMPERRLMAEAFKRAAGKASLASIEQEFSRKGFLNVTKNGRKILSTREILAEEKAMLDFARAGRGTCKPLGYGHHYPERSWLNAGQRRAVEHVMNSRDRIIIVRGVSGTGKTTFLQEAADWIEKGGRKVFPFAPSAKASRKALREKGFAQANTLAMLHADPELQERVRGNVIWLDEAGLVGTKEMNDFFRLADTLDARIVLSGDRLQHKSVSRGSALRQLETQAGLVPVQITEIMRQKGEFRQVTTALSEGRAVDAFHKLDQLGWVRELPNENRPEVLANDFVDLRQQGRRVLAISPTHADGGNVSKAIRAALKKSGLLAKDDRRLPQLVNANFTESERRDEFRYGNGDVLVFHQNAPGIRKGERVTVGEGKLPLDFADRFQVYHGRELAVAEGETLRVTRNGRTIDGKRIENGDLLTVKSFDESGNLVTNRGTVAKDYGFLAPGYVATSVASQGDEVDNVLISQTWESRSATSAEQLYVSVSRARQQAILYVDNKKEVLQSLRRTDESFTATDMLEFRAPESSLDRTAAADQQKSTAMKERGYE